MSKDNWNVIKAEKDLPPVMKDVLWSFKYRRGSFIGNLETTSCFVENIQWHDKIKVEDALAWCEIPEYIPPKCESCGVTDDDHPRSCDIMYRNCPCLGDYDCDCKQGRTFR